MDEFTDDVVLKAGAWDPRFARVLATVVVGNQALAIIDSNGVNGGVVYENIESYRWDRDDGWCERISSGGLSSGWMDGLSYATGEAEPGQHVTVEFRGERHSVETRGFGLLAVRD